MKDLRDTTRKMNDLSYQIRKNKEKNAENRKIQAKIRMERNKQLMQERSNQNKDDESRSTDGNVKSLEKQLKEDNDSSQDEQIENIKNMIGENRDSLNQFFIDLKNYGYLSHVKREELMDKYKTIFDLTSRLNSFSEKSINKIFQEFPDLKSFNDHYVDLINYKDLSDERSNSIKDLNLKILDEEIDQNKEFFHKITDINKKRAIVIDDDFVRVNAGAGTGKTFTIQNKVRYLIEKKGVSPEKILCLCYTVKGAADLNEKVNENIRDGEVRACTFHEFCRSVAYDCGYRKTTDRDILEKVVSNYSKKLLDDGKLNNLIEYFGYYINSIDNADYNSYDELLIYENGKDLKSLKEKFYDSGVSTLTMQGEIVKSIGELIIANYLFMHEIEYVYETNYKSRLLDIIQNRFLYSGNYFSLVNLELKDDWINNFIEEQRPWYTYLPDFYLPEYDIYLEHFGISGTVDDEKWLGKDYIDQMDRKRRYHKLHQTKLLETYYYYLAEGRLIEELEKLLVENHVEIGQMNREYILKILSDTNKIGDFENFNNLVMSFINIFEAQNNQKNQFDKFKKMNESEPDGYKRRRQELFLDIVSDIYEVYYELNEGEKIDNNREVSLALELIQDNKYSKSFDYIFIDEYQDINPIRSLLLSSLQKITNAKLFVVGDDWQSIYRFNGSDLNLFLDFNEYYPNSELIKLEENRRNYDDINDVASDFIMKNKKQEYKELKSIHKWNFDSSPIKIVNYPPKPESKKVLQLYSIITEIINNNPKKEETRILLLGRYNNDIEEFTGNSLFRLDHMLNRVRVICLENLKLDITFMSIHKSKGLEYDEVIILNFKDFLVGFPNKIEDDSILHFLKDKEEYLYAEERRLLYVALTRTLGSVYLLSPNYDKSVFIEELVDDYNIESIELDVDERIAQNFNIFKPSDEQNDYINNMLNKASRLKSLKQYSKSKKIFDEYYKRHPENFKYTHKEDYAWVIYYLHVKKFMNKEDFFSHADFILNLVEQRNLRGIDLSCAYTTTVFDVLKYLNRHKEFSLMLEWLGKINPKLLNPFSTMKNSRALKSKKELYYDYLSNVYYNFGEYEKCIEVSKYALNNLNDMVDDSWICLRLGKSLKKLNRFKEATIYLKRALKLKYCHVYYDLVECYYILKDYLNFLKYMCPVVFSNKSNREKAKFYYLFFKLFIDSNEEQALKHAKFYYVIGNENNWNIQGDIQKYNFDEEDLDKEKIESEIIDIWSLYKKSKEES